MEKAAAPAASAHSRPPARPASSRPRAGRPIAWASPGHFAALFWLATPYRSCFPRRREELPLISTRADAFLQWLHERPEQSIAVVTHSSFLAALCNVALDSRADLKVGEWFANAEMRHVRLAKRGSD